MNNVDQARLLLLEGRASVHRLTFDWSALPDGVAAELFAGQRPRAFMSSGTSGEPKAIRRSADLLVRELDATVALLTKKHDSVHATVHPRSLYGYVGAFIAARLGIPATFDGWAATGRPVTGSNPLVFIVPAAWRSVRAALGRWTGESMTIIHAGSMLPQAVSDWAADRASTERVEILDLFGTTETGVVGARRAHPDYEAIWATCADTIITFPAVDHEGEARPIVTSPRIVDPARPAAASVQLDDWLIPTGDGTFGFRGRRERLVKPGGRRVDLDLLEAQISALLPQLDIACIPRSHPELGEDVDVLVIGTTAVELEVLTALRRAPAASLSFVPRRVRAVRHIPRSPMGKVRRVLALPNEETAA